MGQQTPRQQILDGIAAAVAEKGCHAITIRDLVKHAGIARKTLYEHFPNGRDEALQVAAHEAAELALRVTEDAIAGVTGLDARVDAGLSALLEHMAAHPEAVCLVTINGPAIDPEVLERTVTRFATLLNPEPGLPEQMVVGGVLGIVYRRALNGKAAELPGLQPELARFVLDTLHAIA